MAGIDQLMYKDLLANGIPHGAALLLAAKEDAAQTDVSGVQDQLDELRREVDDLKKKVASLSRSRSRAGAQNA